MSYRRVRTPMAGAYHPHGSRIVAETTLQLGDLLAHLSRAVPLRFTVRPWRRIGLRIFGGTEAATAPQRARTFWSHVVATKLNVLVIQIRKAERTVSEGRELMTELAI